MNLPPLTPTDGRERPVRIDRRRRKVTTPGLAEVLAVLNDAYLTSQEAHIIGLRAIERVHEIRKPINHADPALYRKPNPSEEPLGEAGE